MQASSRFAADARCKQGRDSLKRSKRGSGCPSVHVTRSVITIHRTLYSTGLTMNTEREGSPMPTYIVEPTGEIIYPRDAMPYPAFVFKRDDEVLWIGNEVSCVNERRMREYKDSRG
jgi:hypothetical protein